MYTLTKIRTFIGREGYGLNATLCRDGKPVAFICDDASGGEMTIDFTNPLQNAASYNANKGTAAASEQAALAWATQWYHSDAGAACRKQWADIHGSPEGFVDDTPPIYHLEAWINEKADEIELAKKQTAQLKRWAKTQTVFRLIGDEPGTYRTLKFPVTHPGAVPFITKKYGIDKVEMIYGIDIATLKAQAPATHSPA